MNPWQYTPEDDEPFLGQLSVGDKLQYRSFMAGYVRAEVVDIDETDGGLSVTIQPHPCFCIETDALDEIRELSFADTEDIATVKFSEEQEGSA